ncbi:hypothetical protein [uncultured Sphingomonas sp.]|uniref:hypothetical protein n=1 Tax=uncultured Sphingomonas sp. TaxID=158754 RepID=UPI00263969CE|nr:hypothetical protein [uncultured Sphingomonas sp.]
MKTEVLQRLPDWPARMTADIAAVYMSVSKSTFLTRFGEVGVREGSNVFWARAQLDRIIAKQFSIKQPRAQARDEDSTWDDFR